jgi:hypothetical protein
MPVTRGLLWLMLSLAAAGAPALADDATKAFKEPKVLDTPQPTGAACAVLQRQFDGVIDSHANKPKAVPARQLRKTGEQKCNQGDYAGGVADLVKALKDIHVSPEMP